MSANFLAKNTINCSLIFSGFSSYFLVGAQNRYVLYPHYFYRVFSILNFVFLCFFQPLHYAIRQKQHFYLTSFFYSLTSFIYLKIKFRYKGSWVKIIRQNSRSLVINFKHSHLLKVAVTNYFVRKHKVFLEYRTIVIWGFDISGMQTYMTKVRDLKPASTFTTIGARFGKQVFYKRVGKVSKYIMSRAKIF